MTRRSARIISRTLFGLALAMIAITGIIAFTAYADSEPGVIVVIPADRAPAIAEAAASLGRNCDGSIEDAALSEPATAYCELTERRAAGDRLIPEPAAPDALILFTVSLGWLATGGLLASRQPRNLAGWIFQVIGFALVLEYLTQALVLVGLELIPGSVPWVGMWAMVNEFALLAAALLPLLWLLFPDGRPPSPRWRWAVRLYFVAVGLALVATLFAPGPLNNLVEYGIVYLNPLGISSFVGVAGALIGLGATSAVGIAVASVFGVRGRFKRATGEERQQLRWLRFVTTIAVVLFVALVIGALLIEVTGRAGTPLEDRWWNTLFVLIALTVTIGIPAAYLIAIFRHGLWDLDVVIRKTLVFGILVVLFMILGALVAVVLTNMAIGTLYDDPPLFLVIGLAFGLLATPLYRVSKRIADRIVYGGRATPYQVLTDFSGRIGETYATDDVLQRMAQVLADGTGASSARVLLRVGADLQEAASVGHVDPADEHSVTVVHQGEELGALAVTMPASDPMSPSKELLIRDLARQTGPVLRNVRLIEELRESRRRLVVAQDEERRRLERNIHDGIQQQLVALQVQLRLARTLLDRDHTKVGEMLDALQGASVVALEDLRDLARGIYPPLLADKGLAAALESQARKAAVPTSVEAEGMRRYQQDVEATVYFCALEALNNVAKYAHASSATVSISQANGALTFEVRDDGRGFDPATVAGGTGMQGMADRLAAVGGELRVTSAPGHGTVVTGRIPLEVRT